MRKFEEVQLVIMIESTFLDLVVLAELIMEEVALVDVIKKRITESC